MSQIAELTASIQRKSQELLKSTESAVQSELSKLQSTTQMHCKNVQNELQSAISEAERFQERLTQVLNEIEQMMINRMARMSMIFTVVIVLILMFGIGMTLALTKLYIKPQELKEQLLMRQELEKSGLLVKSPKGTFVVLPGGANCNWTVGEKEACRLPDPPQK